MSTHDAIAQHSQLLLVTVAVLFCSSLGSVLLRGQGCKALPQLFVSTVAKHEGKTVLEKSVVDFLASRCCSEAVRHVPLQVPPDLIQCLGACSL